MRKVFLLPLLIVVLVGFSEAKKQTSIKGLRFASYPHHTRVVIDVNGPVEFTRNRLYNPFRLYFDLKNCSVSTAADSLVVQDNILEGVRIAQFDPDTARVVFDVKKTDHFSAFLLEHPYRIVIDVYANEVDQSPGQHETESDRKVLVEKSYDEIKTIVIDPGHGGKDPGAIGPEGLQEKDITLYVGRKLGTILQKQHGVDVLYTRTKDVFVPLNERTEFANSKKADLFISIHTNASSKRDVKGIETYFLNWTNNRDALRVAARENRVSMQKMQKMQDDLQFILQDLARNNKREESMRLAYSVQNFMVNSLTRHYHGVEDLGVKFALFYVLVGAEMPSILAEVSFISNRDEERRLASNVYRDKIAEALAKGINAYMTESTLIVQKTSGPN